MQGTAFPRKRRARTQIVRIGAFPPFRSSLIRRSFTRIESRKIGRRVTPDAIVHLRRFLKMQGAQASARRAALVDCQISLLPHTEMFGNGIAIISNNLEGVGVLHEEPIAAGAPKDRKDVGRLDCEPRIAHVGRAEVLVKVPFKLKRVGRFDPSEQAQLQRIAGLEVAFARLDILHLPDFDQRASVLVLANKIDRHVTPPRTSADPVAGASGERDSADGGHFAPGRYRDCARRLSRRGHGRESSGGR